MMQVDHRYEENLTPERIDAIFQRLRSEASPHDTKARGVAPGEGAARPSASATEPVRRKSPKRASN